MFPARSHAELLPAPGARRQDLRATTFVFLDHYLVYAQTVIYFKRKKYAPTGTGEKYELAKKLVFENRRLLP
jgi:hypothetical protein